MLTISSLTKYRGSRKVLDSVSCTFERHSIHVLSGANGAGKTTLLHCILGITRYSGDISWDERPAAPGRHWVSPVFHDAPFESKLTGLQNYHLLCGAKWSRKLAANMTWAGTFGVTRELLKRRVSSLSHGERARLALTIAFDAQTDVVVLDEPTSGLDSNASEALVGALRLESQRRTFIIATHDSQWCQQLRAVSWSVHDGRVERDSVATSDHV